MSWSNTPSTSLFNSCFDVKVGSRDSLCNCHMMLCVCARACTCDPFTVSGTCKDHQQVSFICAAALRVRLRTQDEFNRLDWVQTGSRQYVLWSVCLVSVHINCFCACVYCVVHCPRVQDIFGSYRDGASFTSAGWLRQNDIWMDLVFIYVCQNISFANYDGWNVLTMWRID